MTFPQRIDKVFLAMGLVEIGRRRKTILRRLASTLISLGYCCLFFGLGGCAMAAAPREFAPDGVVIQRAIAYKLETHYQQLSRTIAATAPIPAPQNIQVQTLDSFFLQGLPVYHLQGTYDLTLTFPSQRSENRRHNAFDLYLQRQPEGKTWRSLEKNAQGWRSQQLPE